MIQFGLGAGNNETAAFREAFKYYTLSFRM